MAQPPSGLGAALPAQYLSYIIRLWRPGPHAAWRLMLEDIPTGERRVFATLGALCRFLGEQIEELPAANPAITGKRGDATIGNSE
jgi:hypothetical protein